MNSPVLLLVILLLLFLVAGFVSSQQRSIDFAGPLRLWLWARDVRRMQRRDRFPETLRRSYWSPREYQRDSRLLQSIGYGVVNEQRSDPYEELPAGVSLVGRRQPARRRVPMFYVLYEHHEVR
ncbi:MAG: hypothetical protein JOY80_10390 [Candidatus Dormibacteraeota bacterium]|nr:hypothetical protein [Candidatus Dormibacteraeota bacterium]